MKTWGVTYLCMMPWGSVQSIIIFSVVKIGPWCRGCKITRSSNFEHICVKVNAGIDVLCPSAVANIPREKMISSLQQLESQHTRISIRMLSKLTNRFSATIRSGEYVKLKKVNPKLWVIYNPQHCDFICAPWARGAILSKRIGWYVNFLPFQICSLCLVVYTIQDHFSVTKLYIIHTPQCTS